MRWEELRLPELPPQPRPSKPATLALPNGNSDPAHLAFPDGVQWTIDYYYRVVRSEWYGYAQVTLPSGEKIDLLDVVDDGQTTDCPKLYALFGDDPHKVFLVGGPIAYR